MERARSNGGTQKTRPLHGQNFLHQKKQGPLKKSAQKVEYLDIRSKKKELN